MGGGKGGGGDTGANQAALYQQGRDLKEGSPRMTGLEGIDPNTPGYEFIYQGYMDRHEERVQEEKFKLMMEGMMSDRANYASDYAAQMAEAEEKARIAGLQKDRDQLLDMRSAAENEAVNYINNQIDAQMANANLLGIDYSITDEQKASQINNYFSSIWSGDQQSRLEGYMDEVGAPEGWEGWSINRGEGAYQGGEEGKETPVGTSTGIKPIKKEEEEETLDSTAILGVA